MIPWLAATYGAERVSYILFGISQIMFPLSFIYANDNKVNPMETSLLRGLASVLINFGIARYYDMTLDFKYDVTFSNMIKRNVCLVIHGLAIAAAQFYLPLPVVHTISFFSPIFVLIIDYFENGVKINSRQVYCVVASIIGIICTIN
jgi:drug/metabolite transporter (DMT)-like permease